MTAGKDTLAYGQSSEALAARHLKKKGYKIIERNHRNAIGEIDIIARHKGILVFVEVKARRSETYGSPKWAVTQAKQRKLARTAMAYMKKHKCVQTRARFDVVAIQTTAESHKIEVITNAFEPICP